MTVEAYRPVARTVEQLVNDYLHERPTIRFADFQPNILMAIDAVKEIKIADESLRWGGPNIRTAIRLVAAGEFRNPEGGLRFQFAENPRFRATLDYAIYDAHLDEKGNPKLARSTGTENMVIDKAVADGVALDDEQGLLDIVAELWRELPKSEKHLDAVQRNFERERMIHEITRGGTQGFTLITQYGGRRVFDKDGYEVQYSSSGGRAKKKLGGFENMSDEEIQQIHAHVMEKRAAIEAATNGTLKKQVSQLGKDHYQGKFHGDPGSQPVTTPGNAVLIDPRNGQPITRRIDLIHYINSSPNALALLVKPKGTTIRERALEVDRLLGARE